VIARPRFNPELRLRRRNLESEKVVASESCFAPRLSQLTPFRKFVTPYELQVFPAVPIF
jgi:hypothetical protein